MRWERLIAAGTILVACFLASGALAADANIEVNGHVNAKIMLSVTQADQWGFTVDPGVTVTPHNVNIDVSSNRNWQLTAEDVDSTAKATNVGHFTYGTLSSPTSVLTDPLYTDLQVGTGPLTSTQTIMTGSKGVTPTQHRSLHQNTEYTDDPVETPNQYVFNVKFTATQTS